MNSSREYNGEPLDMSWNTPPWANDGETVGASDDNRETGKMTTTDWPEAATPKEELTDKQQRIIKTAVKYPYLEYAGDLYEQSNLDEYVSRGYVAPVLTDHWLEWFGNDPEDVEKEENDQRRFSPAQVRKMRIDALNGKSGKQMAEEIGCAQSLVSRVLTGERYDDVKQPGVLEYDYVEREYTRSQSKQQKLPEDGSKYANNGSTNGRCKITEQDAKEIRKRALDGESRTKIAEDYPIHPSSVGDVLRGDSWGCVMSPPPLKFHNGEYTAKGPFNNQTDESKPEQSVKPEITAADEQQERGPDGYEPQPPTVSNTDTDTTDYTKVLAAGIIGYQLLKTLWSLVSRSDN